MLSPKLSHWRLHQLYHPHFRNQLDKVNKLVKHYVLCKNLLNIYWCQFGVRRNECEPFIGLQKKSKVKKPERILRGIYKEIEEDAGEKKAME